MFNLPRLGKRIEDILGGFGHQAQQFTGNIGNQAQRMVGQVGNAVQQAPQNVQRVIQQAPQQIQRSAPRVDFAGLARNISNTKPNVLTDFGIKTAENIPVIGMAVKNRKNIFDAYNGVREGNAGKIAESTYGAASSSSPLAPTINSLNRISEPLGNGWQKNTLRAPGDFEAGFKNFTAQKPGNAMSLTGGLVDLQDNLAKPFRTAGAQSAGKNQAQIDAMNQSYANTSNNMSRGLLDTSKKYTEAVNKNKDFGTRDTIAFKGGSGAGSVAQYAALNALGGPVLPGIVAAGEQYGQTGQESYDKTGKFHQGAAITDAAVTGVTERLTGKIPGFGESKGLVKAGVMGTVKNMVKGFGVEGAQEGVQQLSSNLIAKNTFDPNRDPMQGVVEAAVIGGALGGAAGGAGGRMQYNQQQENRVNTAISPEMRDSGIINNQIGTAKAENLKIGSDSIGPVDQAQVAKYVQDIQQGVPIEPIVVTTENGQQFVQDGKHRLEALKQMGVANVPVVEKVVSPQQQIAQEQLAAENRSPDAPDPMGSVHVKDITDLNQLRDIALSNDVTGVPGGRAMREAIDRGDHQAWASQDVTGLTYFNKHGDASGDALLQLAADTGVETAKDHPNVNFYHVHGDETFAGGPNVKALEAYNKDYAERLAKKVLTIESTDGTIYEVKGIQLNHGVAQDFRQADIEMQGRKGDVPLENPQQFSKEARKQRGEGPAQKGELAPGTTITPIGEPRVSTGVGTTTSQSELQDTQREVKPTVRQKNSQPVAAKDLLSSYKVPQSKTTQTQDLANQYKMKQETVDRLVSQYGIDKISALAQEVYKSGTARDVNAVVASEANKRWGKPTITAKPEVAPTVAPEVKPVVTAKTQNITDTATGEVLTKDEYIAKASKAADAVIKNNIEPLFKNEDFTVEEFTRQIQEANRLGTDPSPEVAKFYDKNIRPLLKDMAVNIGKEDIQTQNWYLPQYRAGEGQTVNVGGSLVNQMDVDNFGFSQKRTNAIPLEDLDYSLEGIKRLAVQEAAYKARHAIRAKDIQANAQSEGVTLSDTKAVEIAKNEEDLSKTIVSATQEGGLFSSGVQKMDIVDKVGQMGTEKGRAKTDINTEFGQARYLASSTPELMDKVMYPGTDHSVLDHNGFNRYTEAEGLAHGMVADTKGVNVEEYLQNRYKDVNVPENSKKAIIQKVKDSIERAKQDRANLQNLLDKTKELQGNTSKLSVMKQRSLDRTIGDLEERIKNLNSTEGKNEQLAQIFHKAEQAIAREQMVDFLETTNMTGKNMKKVINQEAKRMLLEDTSKQSLATKATNGLLGVTYQAGLGWNAMSALQNVTELKRAYAEFNTDELAYGLKMAAKDPDITSRYGVTPTKFGDITETGGQLEKSKLQKLKPMAAFYATESLKDRVMLHAFEYRHKNGTNGKLGLSGSSLSKATRADFDKLAIKAGQRGTLGFNKSNTGRIMMQFLQYPVKDLKITGAKVGASLGIGKDLTHYDIKMARKFIAKKALSDIALYLIMNAAIGSTWEYISGLQNPFDSRLKLSKDAGMDEKVIANIPGGMILAPFKELYVNMREEARNAQEKDVELSLEENFKKQGVEQLKKSWTSFVPGGNQFGRKTAGFVQDQMKGYNASADGRVRFAATSNPLEIARGAVFGRYTTNNAREYFGSTIGSDLPVVGEKIQKAFNAKMQKPIGERFQKMVDDGTMTVKDAIARSRDYDQKKSGFKENNPSQQRILDDINKTVYNKTTHKNESDVISPEKWDKINSDQSLVLFDRLKQKANDDNKQFGYDVDPIYKLTDKEQIREILKIRSLPTGDDTELKEMNKAKNKWYRDFTAQETEYYKKLVGKNFEQSDDYGPTQRKKDYIALSAQYPQSSALVNQYYDTKAKSIDAGKAFFKSHADQLSNDFDTNKRAIFDWTNKKRKIEGAQPLDWDAFNNVTFGYEDDERKVYNELKYGKGYGGYSNGGGSSDHGSSNPYKYAVSLKSDSKTSKPKIKMASFSKAKSVATSKPTVTLKKSRV